MKALVTGGAGFIGRWVVAALLEKRIDVLALDDLSNGRAEHLREFEGHPHFLGLVRGDLKDVALLSKLFSEHRFDRVFHLGASIHVQKSIDDPGPTFRNDAEGTFHVLEACRREYFARNGLSIDARAFDFDRDVPKLRDRTPRLAVMSTCMVYELAGSEPISESHPYRPASPYAAAKIGADSLALSYFHSYRMPVTVVRPFNTYGPFQKTDNMGGVVSIFLKRDIEKQPLHIKGKGTQTRDLLYVEDCADFVVRAIEAPAAEGEIINAGTGQDIAIKDLAALVCSDGNRVELVPHDHPQAEIPKLLCDARKAERLLGWKPTTPLAEGVRRTRVWLSENRWAW